MIRCLVFAGLAGVLAGGALAHGEHEWIRKGGYRSPVNKELCCGESDCVRLAEAQVRPAPGGYLIQMEGRTEFVPAAEALVSEDGGYHRCHRPDGSRRCFFAPASGS